MPPPLASKETRVAPKQSINFEVEDDILETRPSQLLSSPSLIEPRGEKEKSSVVQQNTSRGEKEKPSATQPNNTQDEVHPFEVNQFQCLY